MFCLGIKRTQNCFEKVLEKKRNGKREGEKDKPQLGLTFFPGPELPLPTLFPPARGLFPFLAQLHTSPLPLHPIGRQLGPDYPSL